MTCEWSLVESILNDNYDHPDCQAAKILFAGVAAHRLVDFPPAWELLMAPSGSMKTDLLESLRGLPRVNFVDEVTPKTFISGKVDDVGKRRKCPASYLHRLGDDAILIAADFSTVTSQIVRLLRQSCLSSDESTTGSMPVSFARTKISKNAHGRGGLPSSPVEHRA